MNKKIALSFVFLNKTHQATERIIQCIYCTISPADWVQLKKKGNEEK